MTVHSVMALVRVFQLQRDRPDSSIGGFIRTLNQTGAMYASAFSRIAVWKNLFVSG